MADVTAISTTKVVLLTLGLLLVILSLAINTAESRKTVIVNKDVKLSQKRLNEIEKIYSGLYARGYSYGEPMGSYNLEVRRKGKHEKSSRSGRKLRRRKIKKIKPSESVKVYAKKYKTWVPSKKVKTVRSVSKSKPKRLYQEEIQVSTRSRPRRRKKYKMSPLQRPSPPPEPDVSYNDYDFTVDPGVEDYFPEETRVFEDDYDSDIRLSKRKKKKTIYSPPPRPKKKKKSSHPQVSYEYSQLDAHDTEDVSPPYSSKTKPSSPYSSVSYSNFIRHPPPKKHVSYPPYSSKYEYDEYPEESEHRETRSKKKSNRKRPIYYDDQSDEKDEVEYPSKSYYDDNLEYRDFEPITARSITREQPRPAPNYGAETYGNRANFEPNLGNSYTVSSGIKYSQPVTHYQTPNSVNYAYNQIPYSQPVVPVPDPYQTSYAPQQPNRQYNNYQQVTPTRLPPSYNTNYQNVPPVRYTDNTDTYHDFNNNVPITKYNSPPYTNNAYNNAEPYPSEAQRQSSYSRPDDDFLTKHSSLYNNGLSGIPIQGDGFGNYGQTKSNSGSNYFKRNTKDFDIGYGELQFDETSSSSAGK